MFIDPQTLTQTQTVVSPINERPNVNCDICHDTGWSVSSFGSLYRCVRLLVDPHAYHPLSPGGDRITRSIQMLHNQGRTPDSRLFEIARTLSYGTAARPLNREYLVDRFFSYVDGDENQRREVTLAMRALIDEWLLPVGSSKRKPYGYWLITDEQDFRLWMSRALAEPVTRIRSLRRLAEVNFPMFAKQIEIDFDLGEAEQ